MYPEVERVSVPRRWHTHSGHGESRQEDLTTRAVARITKKLVDVGYSSVNCLCFVLTKLFFFCRWDFRKVHILRYKRR